MFLAIGQHPEYPLIIAANRDEYHERPSRSMRFWEEQPHILAGKDLREGGTWLGLTRSGYFCTITNYPDKSYTDHQYHSRGELVRLFLMDESPYSKSQRYLTDKGKTYRPFNLIFGNYSKLYTYSNCEQEFTPLTNGYHSVSNGPMNQAWPKVSHGVKKLTDLINEGGKINTQILTEFMQDQSLPISHSSKSGTAPYFSPIFIRGNHYGTRTTTCLLFNGKDVQITESNYNPLGEISGEKEFTFELKHAS
ncbi:MAG: NRDE family protein [Gammaproteobacteria bacterium]|nr:NRDE family protein [Gammaproteobacteria bacterium]